MASFPDLISMNTAKDQCRVLHNDDDDRIDRFRQQAQKIVIDYCKVDDTAYDDSGSPLASQLPFHVEAAMLLVLQNLYDGTEPLSPAVTALLTRERDPALA